jgi:hypothetical protein
VDWQAIELFGCPNPWNLLRGRIVESATIVDAFEFGRDPWLANAARHLVNRPIGYANYGAVLDNVLCSGTTAACSGKLFFFSVPNGVLQKIGDELAKLEPLDPRVSIVESRKNSALL